MKSNLKKLDVGLRGTLDEFKATYTLGFLKKNGYNAIFHQTLSIITHYVRPFKQNMVKWSSMVGTLSHT